METTISILALIFLGAFVLFYVIPGILHARDMNDPKRHPGQVHSGERKYQPK